MRHRTFKGGVTAALVLGLFGLAGATGCASMPEGQSLAQDASVRLRDLRDELVRLKASTVSVANALDSLAHGSGTARDRYNRFQNEHDKLRDHAARMKERGRDMNANTKEYMDNWEKEIQEIDDDELRESAQARRARVERTLVDVRERLTAAREAFDPYDRKLEGIRRYLENDLTAEGLYEAQPKMDEAAGQVRQVQRPLEGAIAKLEDLSRALAAPN